MMRILVSLLCLLLPLACASAQSDAKTNYSQKCALCHGPNGKASVPMGKKMGAADLTSAQVVKLSDAAIRKTITDGKGKMPPYGSILGKEGVEAMVSYVRSLGKVTK